MSLVSITPLSIGHNVVLELTLPFLLRTVPWSQSTPDRISTKTDKSKLPHGLQSHFEPTLDLPCSAAHNFECNAVTTEHNSFSCHLQGSGGTSIQPGTKGRACWFCHRHIYTMDKQQSIKIVSMIRKYHNHKLQTSPWHREEEPLNHHKTPGRQIKQSNQLSLPHQDDCNTRMDIK